MKFFTDIQIGKSSEPIEHSEQILMLGSCFAENMEAKFKITNLGETQRKLTEQVC